MSKNPPIQGVTAKKPIAPLAGKPVCELLEKMRRNPAGDWCIKDVETLCAQTGMKFKPPTRGSHYKIVGPGETFILTIPAEKPVKKPYIRTLVNMADRVRARTGATR